MNLLLKVAVLLLPQIDLNMPREENPMHMQVAAQHPSTAYVTNALINKISLHLKELCGPRSNKAAE